MWHSGQLRKYPSVSVPYVSHVAGVVAILARHGFDAEVQAAGALHDVLEDCGVTTEELELMFGSRVCELVRLSSEEDSKNTSWEERKRAYLQKFPTKPWDAQAITLADKIDNFASIIECAERFGDPWAMFKRGKAAQLERFRALETATRVLPSHPLIDEYVAMLTVMAEVPEPDPLG